MSDGRDGRFRVKRIQTNIVALRERQLLTWLCGRMPGWVTPDRLTALGVLGASLVFAGDLASRVSPSFLWVASFGLLVHWFGDSLDGSLARHRGIERPVYGYFLDHTVDALCNLLIMAGIGATLYVRMDVALFTLVGYYLLCMYVFINNHLSGVFQLSFVGMGPTELRLCLIAINTWMYFAGPNGLEVGTIVLSFYDLVLLFAGGVFVAIFVVKVVAGIRLLRDPSQAAATVPLRPDASQGL